MLGTKVKSGTVQVVCFAFQVGTARAKRPVTTI
jgi:hypothetical protein